MKEKIFDKMEQYGWSLESFSNVYDIHYNTIDKWYDYIRENDYDFTMQDISKQQFSDFVDFMSDFLRAINDIDKEIIKTYNDTSILDTLIMNNGGRIGSKTREEILEEINSFLGGK